MSKIEVDEAFIKMLMMTAAIDYMDNEDRSKRINHVIDDTYKREMEHQKEWEEKNKENE